MFEIFCWHLKRSRRREKNINLRFCLLQLLLDTIGIITLIEWGENDSETPMGRKNFYVSFRISKVSQRMQTFYNDLTPFDKFQNKFATFQDY